MTALMEWRRGWKAVLAGAVGYATGITTWTFTTSMFVPELQKAFGWSRGQIALSASGFIIGAVCAPFIGRLVDLFGVRRVAMISSALFGLATLLLACMNGSLPLYYGLTALIIVIGMGTTGMTFCRVVTTWFDKSRGLALASTSLGMSVVGAVLPPALFFAMSHYGWRAGYVLMAALPLLIALPISALWLKERTGLEAGSTGPVPVKLKPDPWFKALGNWRAIVLCLAGALTFAPFSGLVSQLHPLLTGAGIAPDTAAKVIGLTAVSSLTGMVLSGWLVDRIWPPLVAFIFTIGPVLGCLILMGSSLSVPAACFAVVLVGLAQGAETQLIAFLISRYFGMRNYSLIFGFSVFTTTALCTVANAGFGFAYDRFGDYRLALGVAAAAFLIAALGYLLLGNARHVEPLAEAVPAE